MKALVDQSLEGKEIVVTPKSRYSDLMNCESKLKELYSLMGEGRFISNRGIQGIDFPELVNSYMNSSQQETMYVVLKYSINEIDCLSDFHSYWTKKSEAEKTVEFLKYSYEAACIMEVQCDQKIEDKKGHKITIGVSDKIPTELKNDPNFDIANKDIEAVIKVIQSESDIVSKLCVPIVMLGGVDYEPTADFNLSSNCPRYVKKDSKGEWSHYRTYTKADEEWPSLNVYAEGETPIEAYRAALAYSNIVEEALDDLPDLECHNCDKEIDPNGTFYVIGAIEKGATLVEPVDGHQSVVSHSFLYLCDKGCREKWVKENPDQDYY
jgi:hypothetical protein